MKPVMAQPKVKQAHDDEMEECDQDFIRTLGPLLNQGDPRSSGNGFKRILPIGVKANKYSLKL